MVFFFCYVLVYTYFLATFSWLSWKRRLQTLFRIDLWDKPILVVGCDSGFGQLLAMKLIRQGAPTFAACLTEDGEQFLQSYHSQLKSRSMLRTVRMDIRKQETVDMALQYVTNELGPNKGLYAVVHNAGVLGNVAPDDWQSVDDYERLLDINCFGIIRVVHAFKPLLKKSQNARLVVVTSMVARCPLATCGPYSTSKAAAEAYCSTLRLELKPSGVSVHVVEPGYMETNMTDPKRIEYDWRKVWERQSDETKAEYGEEYVEAGIKALTQRSWSATSTRPQMVVDAYYHALTSRWPKGRYIVGVDAQILLALNIFPTCIRDRVMAFFLWLSGVPVPASCKK